MIVSSSIGLNQLIKSTKVQRDLPAEASCHQNVLVLVFTQQNQKLLSEVCVAFQIIIYLHQNHYVDHALIFDIVKVEDCLVSSFWRIIEEPIKDFNKSHEINFCLVEAISHTNIKHFCEDIALESEKFTEILNNTGLCAIELGECFLLNS